jgi:hypothetical protein
MKFKKDAYVSSKKKASAQRETSSSLLRWSSHSALFLLQPMKKNADKSSSKKKKTTKKGESKVALTMMDLYDKEIPSKATKEDTSTKIAAVGEEGTRLSSDVATPTEEKGNLVYALNSVETGSGKKN